MLQQILASLDGLTDLEQKEVLRVLMSKEDRLEKLMMNTTMLTKDLGTILVGEDAVKEGIIREVGGMKEALQKLHALIGNKNKEK